VTGPTLKPAADVPVTFTIVAGGAGGSFVATGSPTVETVATNASGVATAPTLAANTTSGSYFVSVAIQGVVIPALFSETNKAGAAASLTVSTGTNQTATVGTAFAHTLQVLVKDQYGNVVPNASVTFTSPSTGATGAFNATGLSHHITVKTNASGLATALALEAGGIAGSYKVTASIGSLTTSLPETNLAGSPAEVIVTGGSGQRTTVDTAFASALEVKVTDRFGNSLDNVTVTFLAPSKGVSGTFETTGSPTEVFVNTGSEGVASAPLLMANADAGVFTVTASATGVKKKVSFRETNVA
jgi:hypothetical protein